MVNPTQPEDERAVGAADIQGKQGAAVASEIVKEEYRWARKTLIVGGVIVLAGMVLIAIDIPNGCAPTAFSAFGMEVTTPVAGVVVIALGVIAPRFYPRPKIKIQD